MIKAEQPLLPEMPPARPTFIADVREREVRITLREGIGAGELRVAAHPDGYLVISTEERMALIPEGPNRMRIYPGHLKDLLRRAWTGKT